jgi:hypothetical protein
MSFYKQEISCLLEQLKEEDQKKVLEFIHLLGEAKS